MRKSKLPLIGDLHQSLLDSMAQPFDPSVAKVVIDPTIAYVPPRKSWLFPPFLHEGNHVPIHHVYCDMENDMSVLDEHIRKMLSEATLPSRGFRFIDDFVFSERVKERLLKDLIRCLIPKKIS